MIRFFVLTLTFLINLTVSAQVILLDPGHGGNEVGAKITYYKNKRKHVLYEKEMTLKLAKLIQKRLKRSYKTHLTRNTDKRVELDERAMIAEKVNADIVLSIHFNSAPVKNAYGIETFYLDNHNNEAVLKVEAAENAAFSKSDSIVNKILIDLAIKLTSTTSKQLAEVVHKNIINNVSEKHGIRDRKYRPGNFYVLALSKRPGLLLEAGFLSNPRELKKITNPSYLNDYADGVYKGINQYFERKKIAESLAYSATFEKERESIVPYSIGSL